MRASSKRPKATPEAIVAAAREIAREKGWEAVTIRALAARLGYASPILYEHFRNKDAVLVAAAREGFAALAATMGRVEAETPEARVVALGVAYVEFARREPELYRVMHGLDGAVSEPRAIAAESAAVVAQVADALAGWASGEGVAMPDPLGATETLWCLAHGVASLVLAGRLEDGAERVAEAGRAILAGWKAQKGCNPDGRTA